MSASFRADYVEAALLALLKANLPAAYTAAGGIATGVNIDTLGGKDFDDDGFLVLDPPSVRLRFKDGPYDPMRDNQRLTYQAGMLFEILCYESSLRSPGDQRRQTLILVAAVQDQLAGARLTLSDSEVSWPIAMKRLSLVEQQTGPDELFSLLVEVGGSAQFSGVNANFGS